MNQKVINDIQPAKRKRAGGGRAFHSRLESFVEFIRQQRQQRKTWKEIAAALSREKDCAITAQGVHQFYRRHLQRRAKGHWEDQANQPITQPNRTTVTASRPQKGLSPLPPQQNFQRPDRTKCNTDQYT
jgi:DNA-binding transcriptional MerR regulator